MTLKLISLKQRNHQSVAELIAYLNALEQQITDLPLTDCERRTFLFAALHHYIREAIMIQDRVWETREELELVATNLEASLPPPEGIKVRKEGYQGPPQKTGQNTSQPAPRAENRLKSVTRNVIGYANRKRKQETRTAPTSNSSKAQRTTPTDTSKSTSRLD